MIIQYVNLVNENTAVKAGDTYIPAGGTLKFSTPIHLFEPYVGSILNRKVNGVVNNTSTIGQGNDTRPVYWYTTKGSPTTASTVNGVSIPAGGTTLSTEINSSLERYVGVSVDRYIDGRLNNTTRPNYPVDGFKFTEKSISLSPTSISEVVNVSSTNAQSSVFVESFSALVYSTVDCFVRIGLNPVAVSTGSDQIIPANQLFRLEYIPSGQRIGFITASETGKVYITKGG